MDKSDKWLKKNEEWKKANPDNDCCKAYGCLQHKLFKGFCVQCVNKSKYTKK